MAEATLAMSFHPWGTPLKIDTVDAVALEEEHRAVPVDGLRRWGTPAASRDQDVPGAGSAAERDRGRGLGPDGEKCADREVGVLHLRGECVTDLYLTVDGPVPTRDPDGWLDTGDLGYLLDGEVVVCGRVKDVIIMGGRNIYPTDIERIAERSTGVRAGNAVAVRWKTANGRESFALAVESREAGRRRRGRADRLRGAGRGDVGDRRATRGGDRAPGRAACRKRHPAS